MFPFAYRGDILRSVGVAPRRESGVVALCCARLFRKTESQRPYPGERCQRAVTPDLTYRSSERRVLFLGGRAIAVDAPSFASMGCATRMMVCSGSVRHGFG